MSTSMLYHRGEERNDSQLYIEIAFNWHFTEINLKECVEINYTRKFASMCTL